MSKNTPSGKPLHVMIDIETLSTTANAAILSIAAVPFAVDGFGGTFPYWTWYKKVDVLSQPASIFHRDPDTIAWWERQDKAVMQEAYAGTEKMHEVLHNLRVTLIDAKEAVGATRLEVWSFGGNFDIPILEHAFNYARVPYPWHYRYVRCFRTLKALCEMHVPESDAPRAKKHTALDDALVQAEHAQRILQHLHLNGVAYA